MTRIYMNQLNKAQVICGSPNPHTLSSTKYEDLIKQVGMTCTSFFKKKIPLSLFYPWCDCSDLLNLIKIIAAIFLSQVETQPKDTNLSSEGWWLSWEILHSTLSRFEAFGINESHSSFKCSFPLGTSSRANHWRENMNVHRSSPESTFPVKQFPQMSQAAHCEARTVPD